ncbi:MAG: class I SAM-dependent methyltransferase [Candidatus Yanofskybacteria bacterium]|nr:class I SAM-dependent methyltransferase [Candidatus Yanofskybacteria bacterium]
MTYEFDRIYDEKLKELAARSGRILDVGGGRPFQKRLSGYRELLSGKEYVTIDIDPTTGPDVVGDAHALPFPDASFDAVLHSSVLEHLHSPWIAVREMHRVLKPGGLVLGVVPWVYPYHARKGHYADYWRFTRDGLQQLFSGYSHVEVKNMGGWFMAAGRFIPGYWRLRPVLEPILYGFDRFVSASRSTTPFHMIWAIK